MMSSVALRGACATRCHWCQHAQRDCGSTSTTAVSPARRIAGAAAASRRAACARDPRAAAPSSRRAARGAGRAGAGAAPGRAGRRRGSRLQLLERAHDRLELRPGDDDPHEVRGTAGSRASRRRSSSSVEEPRRRRGAPRSAIGRASGWNVCTSTRPGASRPLRPGELRDQLERPLLGAEVGHARAPCRRRRPPRARRRRSGGPSRPSACRAARRRRRPRSAAATAASCSGFATASASSRISSSSGKLARELALELLRARAEPRELGRAARRAVRRRRLA